MDSEERIRKLKSKDGQIFEVDEKKLKVSQFFNDFMKDFPDCETVIEVTEVASNSLKKIIEYLEHYEKESPKEIPKPLPHSDLKPIISEWDYGFINPMNLEEVIDLVNAANYLNIESLVNLACARLASEMTNCSIEEARTKFGIECDMNEEEIKEIDKYPLD